MIHRLATMTAALALAACGGDATAPEAANIASGAPAPAASEDTESANVTMTPVPATVASDIAEPDPDAREERGRAGATRVLTRYLGLLAKGSYRQAYLLWEDQGAASGMSAREFEQSFARYASYDAAIGPAGREDAGAGQRYVAIPVRITGTLRDGGAPFVLEGPITLHRVANIDGATLEQRRWRLRSSELKPRPGAVPADPERAAMPPALNDARYTCVDGAVLTVRFDNDADTATVLEGGRTIATLAGQRPASGIWYAADGIELRGKGRDASFTRPGRPPVACRAG